MRVKSKYRQAFKDGGRVDGELPVEPPIEQPIESAPPEAPTEPPAPQPEPSNDAALALQRQIEELRKSEEIQRQQAAHPAMPQQPTSREARLAAWQQHGGLSNDEVEFFQRIRRSLIIRKLPG